LYNELQIFQNWNIAANLFSVEFWPTDFSPVDLSPASECRIHNVEVDNSVTGQICAISLPAAKQNSVLAVTPMTVGVSSASVVVIFPDAC